MALGIIIKHNGENFRGAVYKLKFMEMYIIIDDHPVAASVEWICIYVIFLESY